MNASVPRLRLSPALALAVSLALVPLGRGGQAPVSAQSAFTEGYRLVDVWTSREPSASVARMAAPAGVDVSPDGTVYAVDQATRLVFVLSRAGLVTARWPAEADTGTLVDVAASLERVFVLGPNQMEVRSRDGSLIGKSSVPGATGVAAGPDGRVYVARRTGADLQAETVIQIFDRDGRDLETWAASPFVIVSPRGVAVAPDGKVYLAADGAVYVFEAGQVVGGLRVPDGVGDGDVLDVAADGQGRLFGVHGANVRRVVVWDVASKAAVGVQTVAGATALAVGPDAGLTVSVRAGGGAFSGLEYFADRSDLAALPQQWGVSDESLGKLVAPRRLATSADGSVFILDSGQSLQRWSADGQPLERWVPEAGSYTVDVIGGGVAPCIAGPRFVRCLGAGGSTSWTAQPSPQGWFSAADGSSDLLAAADLAEQQLWLLDRNGNLVDGWALSSQGSFVVTPDVAMDGDTVYLVDRDQGQILVRSLTGTPKGPGAITVQGKAVRLAAGDGYLYALTDDGYIWKFSAGGTAVTAWQPAPDGSPEDLAVGPHGRVYVTDPPRARVLVFESDGPVPDVPPPPEPSRCAVSVNKQASPAQVLQGDKVQVTLSVRGSCPEGDGRIDVVLVVDQSGSMAGTPLASAQAAAVSFLGFLTPGRAQVSLVGFSTTAAVLQSLTDDMQQVVRAIGRITAGGQTVYTDALQSALRELTGPRGRPDVPQVVVMLSDGKPTDRTQVLEAAGELKADGITIYTIGLGSDVDAGLLGMIASDPSLYFDAPSESDLAAVYASIARLITAGRLLVSGTVVDLLPPDMHYIFGSSKPPAAVTGRTLSWQLADVPTAGVNLTYLVRPSVAGLRPANESATLDYLDGAGQPGSRTFPIPTINVLLRDAWPAYLPQVWKHICKPQRADVVLVFDTSSSMTGPADEGGTQTKLDAALEAGRTFLNAMQLPDDQAAIVTFDSDGRRVQGLTGSRAELELSLASVTSGRGTRMDKGLELALVELLGARHRDRNNPVIILLSDGLPEPGSERHTLEVALDVRAAGISLFTIGLGQDADADFLWLLAGDSSRTFEAPQASELAAIYGQIAGRVLCY